MGSEAQRNRKPTFAFPLLDMVARGKLRQLRNLTKAGIDEA